MIKKIIRFYKYYKNKLLNTAKLYFTTIKEEILIIDLIK